MLLLGEGGKTVYWGRSELLTPYLGSLGFKNTKGENPADFMIDVCSGLEVCIDPTTGQEDKNFACPGDLFALWEEKQKPNVRRTAHSLPARLLRRRMHIPGRLHRACSQIPSSTNGAAHTPVARGTRCVCVCVCTRQVFAKDFEWTKGDMAPSEIASLKRLEKRTGASLGQAHASPPWAETTLPPHPGRRAVDLQWEHPVSC